MFSLNSYDEDYYKRGIETGKSCYFDYRWLPETTISMAMTIIDYLGITRDQTILDYGAAFGYLVKAFRLLHRKAWGVDVSEYAISNADSKVAQYCTLLPEILDIQFDFCIAKDVFEHIEKRDLPKTFNLIKADTLFAVIPLGENGRYRANANNFDVTHVTCRPKQWWINLFSKNGWNLENFTFQVPGIKDSYNKIPEAHGFFVLKKKWI